MLSTGTRRFRMAGVSVIALATASVVATTPVHAQDASANPNGGPSQSAATPAEDSTAIIVTGTRRALKTAQQIKRDADTVVDSITATDIGAFPDKSVAEALQRVPGVTVNRFAASDDTSHFSADPSVVLVRGLSQVRSEYNGRDTFSANSSRGLSWGDIAPELMAGVDVYKNQTAEMIEGGLAGSINLRTRVPFDQKGQTIEINAIGNYGDLRKKVTPEISGPVQQPLEYRRRRDRNPARRRIFQGQDRVPGHHLRAHRGLPGRLRPRTSVHPVERGRAHFGL